MRQISIGGVPEHKRRESEELAAQMAAFLGQAPVPVTAVPVPAPPVELPEPGPQQPPRESDDSIVMELRAIRAEAMFWMARLERQAQGYTEKPLVKKFPAAA